MKMFWRKQWAKRILEESEDDAIEQPVLHLGLSDEFSGTPVMHIKIDYALKMKKETKGDLKGSSLS